MSRDASTLFGRTEKSLNRESHRIGDWRHECCAVTAAVQFAFSAEFV